LRLHIHPTSTGICIRQCGGDTVALTEQGIEFPTYGRNASINGFVTLYDREMVSVIVFKIKGKMDVMISGSVPPITTKLVNESYTLWSSEKTRTSACPSAAPFSTVLPTRFQDYDDLSRPLPPTYDMPFSAVPGISLKSSYTVSVTITRAMSRKFRFLTKRYPFPLFTVPERGRRALSTISRISCHVKIVPEEFRQVGWQLLPQPKSTVQSIDLHLFLPVVEIFGLTDTIPFHVQLTGFVSSLLGFVPELEDTEKSTIVGSLVRQIVFDLNGRHMTRSIALGDAKMTPRPPGAAAVLDAHEASLD
ncbi:hypothetical protein B0H14DRAFT_3555455, partial [Mycena olivaceomarginata]